MRIAVVGYGIAGIAAALFLRRGGHQVTHFEQAAQPAFNGAGLLLQPPGLAVLRKLGLEDAARARGTAIIRLVGRTDDGRAVMDLRLDEFSPSPSSLGIQRGALFRIMRDADSHFPVLHAGRRIVRADAREGRLTCDDGKTFGPFDVIVAADGDNSRLRATTPDLVRSNRPYAWGALICMPCDAGNAIPDIVMQCFRGPDHVSLWPVGTLAPGEPRRINLSWRLLSSEQPQNLEDVAAWKRKVIAIFPQAAALLRQVGRPADLIPAFYRDVRLRRFYRDRVVFIGDAAHSMSPQLGQGASLALLDAYALAVAFSNHRCVEQALAAFDRRRRASLRAQHLASRAATFLFQSGNPILTTLRDRAFYPFSRIPAIRRSILQVAGARGLAKGILDIPPSGSRIIRGA